jgi:hypothetical protein
MEKKVDGVYRELFDTSLRVGADALKLLGWPAHVAERAARQFRRQDEQVMHDFAGMRRDEAFVSKVRERMNHVQQVLTADRDLHVVPTEEGWDSEVLRQAVLSSPPPPKTDTVPAPTEPTA